MSNKKVIEISKELLLSSEQMVAPFGDGNDDAIKNHAKERSQSEKGYEKMCKSCTAKMPESMKEFIEDDFVMEDEPHYCNWCNFIRTTEIDELVMENIRKESAAKRKNNVDYEDDGADAIWELEESGAFSDEGIMPGCHYRNWDYECEMVSIAKEFADMKFVGNLLRIAREKFGMTKENLASELDIPESFITDLEDGQYISRHGDVDIRSITPIAEPVVVNTSVVKEEREWWQGVSDDAIVERIADYLKNPNKQIEEKGSSSTLPF